MTLKEFLTTNCVLPDTTFKILAKNTIVIHEFTTDQLSSDKSHIYDFKAFQFNPIGDDVLNANITTWAVWVTLGIMKFTIYIDKTLEDKI